MSENGEAVEALQAELAENARERIQVFLAHWENRAYWRLESRAERLRRAIREARPLRTWDEGSGFGFL